MNNHENIITKELESQIENDSEEFTEMKTDEEKIIAKELESQNENDSEEFTEMKTDEEKIISKESESQNENDFDVKKEKKIKEILEEIIKLKKKLTIPSIFISLVLLFIICEHLLSFTISSLIVLSSNIKYENFYIFYYSVGHGFKFYLYFYFYYQMNQTKKIISLILSILIIVCITSHGYIILFPYIVGYYSIIIESFLENTKNYLKQYHKNNKEILLLIDEAFKNFYQKL